MKAAKQDKTNSKASSSVGTRIHSYHELKTERFSKSAPEALACLNSVLEENVDEPALVVEAIKSVATAKGISVEQLAKLSKRGPSTIHKALSRDGNPSLETLTAILHAMDLRLQVASAS